MQILNAIVKYLQYNQLPIGHNGLEIKAPEERHGIKLYTTAW